MPKVVYTVSPLLLVAESRRQRLIGGHLRSDMTERGFGTFGSKSNFQFISGRPLLDDITSSPHWQHKCYVAQGTKGVSRTPLLP